MLEDITYEDGAVYSRETLVPTHKTTTWYRNLEDHSLCSLPLVSPADILYEFLISQSSLHSSAHLIPPPL
jgi:hypothetical protein